MAAYDEAAVLANKKKKESEAELRKEAAARLEAVQQQTAAVEREVAERSR